MKKINVKDVNLFIQRALKEDIGQGDHTSMACIPAKKSGVASIFSKESGVIAGVKLATMIIQRIDSGAKVRCFVKDGENVSKGQKIITLKSSVRNLLKAERIILNCMQRMSGIATVTNKMVKCLKGTKTKLLDTRKTTPSLRWMEKWAVRIGGGTNHRFGLYDRIMLKENHIHFGGGIKISINKVKAYLRKRKSKLKIEIEVINLNEVNEILSVGMVDRILLDNMDIPMLKKAVQMINGRFETEASGNITIANAKKIAETGVDFISCGAITHTYKSMDLSMLAQTVV